jgi:hypothetical protein
VCVSSFNFSPNIIITLSESETAPCLSRQGEGAYTPAYLAINCDADLAAALLIVRDVHDLLTFEV